MGEPIRMSENYMAQAQAAVEIGCDLIAWEHVMIFILHYWHGLEVLRIGDGFSVMRKEKQ